MRRAFPWLALLLLAAGIYRPGLQGSFLFDDFANIVDNPAIHADAVHPAALAAALSGPTAGPLGRPVSVLSFALTHALFGLDPFAFKAINLLIHLVNGLLVGWLLRLLFAALSPGGNTAARWLPLWVAGVWLLHPINVMPVLLSVQRMTLLSGTFVLLALIAHVRGLGAGAGRRFAWLAAAWLLCWPLAILSKETGLLFPLYALLLTLLLRPRRFLPILAGIALPAAFVLGAVLWYLGPGWLDAGYATRSFTLGERLLTEARVLWFYLGQIVLPAPTAFGFFLDDFTVSADLLQPPQTALALAGWAGVLALLAAGWRRQPLICFGLAWFLAGHLLESTVLPLEIAFEYRNYLPALGPLLALGSLGTQLLARARLDHPGATITATALLPIAVLALLTWLRADQWGDPLRGHQIEAAHHPRSARANYTLALTLMQAGRGDAGDLVGAQMIRHHLAAAGAADPTFKPAHLGLLVWACASGRPVEPGWLDDLGERLETTPFGPKDRELPDDLLRPLIRMPRCLERSQAVRLFEAGSRNGRIAGSLRARFLEAAGDYELLVSLDPRAARAYFLRASGLDAGNIRLQEKLDGPRPSK